MSVVIIIVALILNINSGQGDSELSCANVRCSGPCLETSKGPKCCSLDEGCSIDDYNKKNCVKCGDIRYENECYAKCNGNDVESEQCSSCEQVSGCKTAGCSGELCVAKNSDIAASICIFKCEFECVKFQTCGKNETGGCGWITNPSDVAAYFDCIRACDRDANHVNHVNENEGRGKLCRCTMEYNPLCCNGKTYSNPCSAECKGGIPKPAEKQRECKLGKCPKI
eukprot:UN07127